MSVDVDSPTHSSSSDDFAAFLAGELDADSDEEEVQIEDDDDEVGTSDLRVKRQRVEVSESIAETSGLCYTEQTSIDAVSISEDKCAHASIIKGLCIKCGQKLDDETVESIMGSAVPLKFIHKDMYLGEEDITRVKEDLQDLLRHRKLILVLDLDHTLLNSTRIFDLAAEEGYLHHKVDSLHDISKGQLFKLENIGMMTKLRPFVRQFLEEANKKYVMYIYTMGQRAYAKEMAKLLDPQNVYFPSRVIAKEDGTKNHQKGLDVVLGRESAILVLDDTEYVWKDHRENLILMERYHYFASSRIESDRNNRQSLSLANRDENEDNGTLAIILEVLKKIHERFFDLEHGPLVDRDVRKELVSVRKGVLEGCKIVFSGFFQNRFPTENLKKARDIAEKDPLWKMAEELGAVCVIELDQSVTHVIAKEKTTEKARWVAEQNKKRGEGQKKFLVNQSWLEASSFFWKKQPEDEFQVS